MPIGNSAILTTWYTTTRGCLVPAHVVGEAHIAAIACRIGDKKLPAVRRRARPIVAGEVGRARCAGSR